MTCQHTDTAALVAGVSLCRGCGMLCVNGVWLSPVPTIACCPDCLRQRQAAAEAYLRECSPCHA